MTRALVSLAIVGAAVVMAGRLPAEAACCFFSAAQPVEQPSQRAFITWDPQEGVESFTVQPKFEGAAGEFGMVIPTPSRPRLYEMPREFFRELGVFTTLKPMARNKYRSQGVGFGGFGGGAGMFGGGFGRAGGFAGPSPPPVDVVESGLVGTLDYKIVTAEQSGDLYQWLKDNRYSYKGDEETLAFYVRKRWFFTVMKIDPMQARSAADGKFVGDITPTRFVFTTRRLVYPLRITQISVPKRTTALLYIQAPQKMDLWGRDSYQLSFAPQWKRAADLAYPELLTSVDREWKRVVERETPSLDAVRPSAGEGREWQPTTLEWAKKLTSRDIGMLGTSFVPDRTDREMTFRQLRNLRGHLREGQWLTRMRRTFARSEMVEDLTPVPAQLGGTPDEIEYTEMMP